MLLNCTKWVKKPNQTIRFQWKYYAKLNNFGYSIINKNKFVL